MFKTRLISGIVLMAITIALMVNGGFPLFWVITAISVIGLFELYRAVGMEKTLPAVVGYLSSIVIDILILDNYGTDGMLCHCISEIQLGTDDDVVLWPDLCYRHAFVCI